MFDKAMLLQNYVNGFATGFIAGMAFMALAVICFVSAVRHLLHLPPSDPQL
jgi:hypothetical protein